jgi:hypothetical protein
MREAIKRGFAMPQTAKQKKKDASTAKKEQAWLASELLQGEELARPTSAPVSRMLRDGFVLDMNPEDQLAVIEGNDTEDFLSKSRLLAARLGSATERLFP